MLKTLSLLREDLRQKALFRYGNADSKSLLQTLMADGTAAMVVYRAMQASRRNHLPVLEMLFNKMNSAWLNCVIGRGAEFGPGFVLGHSTGVVINGAVRGGRNIVLEHQVTIGAEAGQNPTLGNDVYVGAGAKVVGAVTVGNGARIGANAVVVKDVEPNTTVAGIPARCVRRREPDRASGK
jgi:serine O-acetyltransferase